MIKKGRTKLDFKEIKVGRGSFNNSSISLNISVFPKT